ncbi:MULTISPECIES: zinc-binding dehydrogenase [unclassified Streptomyces]|uniref:zinc-binding dehydrogenase n=1 Tax=unclassified Streptomyces TaxID=2593676 RepID=UPI0003661860|nr:MULTISPECIES: zinc-binding dehydrogenase [unclassified Streptomyces]
MTATMTALFGGTGPDWTPRQVPVHVQGPGQIVVRAHAVALNNADAVRLAAADGSVRPLIESTWSFDTAAPALARLRSHRAHGEIVLTVP